MSKCPLSSSMSSKTVKRGFTILHENPPPYKTENCVTPFILDFIKKIKTNRMRMPDTA